MNGYPDEGNCTHCQKFTKQNFIELAIHTKKDERERPAFNGEFRIYWWRDGMVDCLDYICCAACFWTSYLDYGVMLKEIAHERDWSKTSWKEVQEQERALRREGD